MSKLVGDKRGRINISIALTGLIGLAGLLFLLYIFSNMPESGIESPDVGSPLLLIGGVIVGVVLLVYLLKRLS